MENRQQTSGGVFLSHPHKSILFDYEISLEYLPLNIRSRNILCLLLITSIMLIFMIKQTKPPVSITVVSSVKPTLIYAAPSEFRQFSVI
jgi:hypothetical protein